MKNKYVFTKDDFCIALHKVKKVRDKKSKNYGEEQQILVGYFPSVEAIVKKLVMLELITSGDLKDLLIDLKKVKVDVEKYIDKHI